MRVAKDYRQTSRENYKRWCEDNPTISLSFVEWQNILYEFNEGFRDYLLETGEIAKMPYGFGNFCITKRKRKKFYTKPDGEKLINLPVDWKKTREAGYKIYHFNSHTEGYSFKLTWFVKSARFLYSEVWSFKPSRLTSRLITHYLTIDKSNQHKYKEWTSLSKKRQ